jgi:hypothetical protein
MSKLVSAQVFIGNIAYPLIILTEKKYKKVKAKLNGIEVIPRFMYMDSNEKFFIAPKPSDNFKLICLIERLEQIGLTTDSCEY